MSRQALEAGLHERWDREQLVVYGDYLQSQGDPRGELIAIDLHAAEHGLSEDLELRRIELVLAWFGDRDGARLLTTCKLENGFIEDLDRNEFAESSNSLLADLLARGTELYVRGVTISGRTPWIKRTLTELASRVHPWLRRLTINCRFDRPTEPIVTRKRATSLLAAMPRLDTLEVCGRRVFGEFVHPGVRTLRVTGLDALGSLSGEGPALATVTELDFGFVSETSAYPEPAAVAAMLPAARLPNLKRLDLGRNEPGGEVPNNFGGNVDVFGFLRDLDLATQLTYLRVPSIRSPEQLVALDTALARMPRLEQLAVARTYSRFARATPRHPNAAITVPPPYPWPPQDSVSGRDALKIKLPDEPYGDDVDLTGAVRLMEHRFDRFSERARTAWTELWEFVQILPWEDEQGNTIVMPLPSAVLLDAITALADDDDVSRWTELAATLRNRAYDMPPLVNVSRYWGW